MLIPLVNLAVVNTTGMVAISEVLLKISLVLYDQVVSSIDDKDTMAKTFGLLLHPIQDFYAHSNWIELGRNDLVESNSDRSGLF